MFKMDEEMIKNAGLFLLFLVMNCSTSKTLLMVLGSTIEDGVQLFVYDNQVMMENGLVKVNISSPLGLITGIQYKDIIDDNLLEILNGEDNRGYWDLYWTRTGNRGSQVLIKGTSFKVIVQNESQVEISFTRTWNSSSLSSSSLNSSDSNNKDDVPLNIDIRYVMLKGSSGFYTYGIYEHVNGWPDFNLNRTRVAFKLRKDKFQYAAISKTQQRRMPLPEDREPPRGKLLQFKEAALLVDPVEPEFKGQVDDKYMYANNNEDIKVHGWVSSDPLVGFWHITASDEYRSGGPLKQDLTSHVGPTSLTVFLSSHYMGQDAIPIFRNGEPWKKVYGPVFLYLNTAPPGTNKSALWDDADKQLEQESDKWPYSFLSSTDYPKADQRGSVLGKLLVRDRYINKVDIPAKDAYIGLALPGEVGSWQRETKGYQFWTKADLDGSFTIKNIHTGDYNLYAWVPGFIGDYKFDKLITVKTGESIKIDDDLIYEPPRNGTTLWEIGIPDRTAAEFFIPDVDPKYVNPLYLKQDRFRQYGLWEQYSVLYPKEDLVYTINTNDYRKDWFYAQVTRKVGNAYNSTTWQIKFELDNVNQVGTVYKLRVALASTTGAELQIRVNDLKTEIPHFTTGVMYKDNAIARHGIHGLYLLFNVNVRSDWLKNGENTIFLTQVRGEGPFLGIMYDYIRFEAPPEEGTKTRPMPEPRARLRRVPEVNPKPASSDTSSTSKHPH